MNGYKLAIPAVIVAAAVGASSGLYIKSLPFSSFAMTGFRMGVPFLFFLPLVIKRGVVSGPDGGRKRVFSGSLLNAVRMFLYVLAYKLTTLTNAVVLLYLWPIFALLLNSIIYKQRLKVKEFLILFMALTGVVLLNIKDGFSLSGNDLLGSLVMILSALIFSVAMLFFKEILKGHSEGEVLYFQNAIGALVFIPFLLMELPGAEISDIGFGLLYGFSAGVIGFGLFFYALKRLPIFQYGALTYVEILWGVLYGVFLIGEVLTFNVILGVAFILVSSFLSRFSPESSK